MTGRSMAVSSFHPVVGVGGAHGQAEPMAGRVGSKVTIGSGLGRAGMATPGGPRPSGCHRDCARASEW